VLLWKLLSLPLIGTVKEPHSMRHRKSAIRSSPTRHGRNGYNQKGGFIKPTTLQLRPKESFFPFCRRTWELGWMTLLSCKNYLPLTCWLWLTCSIDCLGWPEAGKPLYVLLMACKSTKLTASQFIKRFMQNKELPDRDPSKPYRLIYDNINRITFLDTKALDGDLVQDSRLIGQIKVAYVF
jgi:hypothetical protein